jgi:uncharacterized coiled-coil protein SlyX
LRILVAHLFDNAPDAINDEAQEASQPRPWVLAGAVVGLAIFGSASALAWRAWGGGLPAVPFLALETAPGPVPPAADKALGSRDFVAFQQQIAGSQQSTAQLLAAQQAEIKRLSDQVSALTAKVDTLQHPPASAPTAIPQPVAPAAPAARKKSAASRPPPGISTGGAPLPQR